MNDALKNTRLNGLKRVDKRKQNEVIAQWNAELDQRYKDMEANAEELQGTRYELVAPEENTHENPIIAKTLTDKP